MSPARDAASRYRDVPVVAVPDARGRVLAARELRLVPDVEGTFAHTVVAGDRLDGLASAYYRRPLVWWHIVDANADVLSPWALVGTDPVVVLTVPVRIAGDPPWTAVVRALRALPGVEEVTVVDDVQLSDEPRTINGQQVLVTVGRPVRALVVRRNEAAARRAGSGPADIVAAVTAAGFTVGPLVHGDAVGSEIVVPPAPTGGA